MRPNVRKAAIFEFVERSGKATVDELADRFDTSPETVRRDLNALADAGQVRKVHGGVLKVASGKEDPFHERLNHNMLAKQIVAEKLLSVVSAGQSILIDTGSTTLIGAEALTRINGLTIITNSTRIAEVATRATNHSDVILLGGSYNHDNAQTVGPATCAEISRYRTDHAILTIGTLDEAGGFDYSQEEAQVARAMINVAERVTILADTSKLNKRSTYQVCGLEKIDTLILDKEPDAQLRSQLDSAKVKVL